MATAIANAITDAATTSEPVMVGQHPRHGVPAADRLPVPGHQDAEDDDETTSCGRHMSATNAPGCWSVRSTASRLLRLEIGSNSEAALDNQTVAKAKGNAGRSSSAASASATGVSITAVVSMLSRIVVAVARRQ